jgi:hypothetical protein
VKHKKKNIEFNSREQIAKKVAKFWNDLSFDLVQRVFEEWIMRLE